MSSHLSSIRLRISSNAYNFVPLLRLSHDTCSSNILSFWAVLLLLPPYIFIISSLVGQIWTINFFTMAKTRWSILIPIPYECYFVVMTSIEICMPSLKAYSNIASSARLTYSSQQSCSFSYSSFCSGVNVLSKSS